jgi:HlyD family secretion protein
LDAVSRFKKATADFERNQYLHNEGVIADVEFEDFVFKRNQAELAIALIRETQMSQWQSQLNSYEVELMRIEADAGELEKDKKDLIVRSPVTGTVQNMAGIYSGSFIYPNQELASISPDTSLIIEVFVTPYDIGLLQKVMPVKFQVDAFNYSQWGLASGKILEVSNDVHMIDGKPLFKVQCSLDDNYLQLKNGYRGYLRKGMTLRARFLVAQRTLYQLLYDKVEDWIDPNAVNHDIPAVR